MKTKVVLGLALFAAAPALAVPAADPESGPETAMPATADDVGSVLDKTRLDEKKLNERLSELATDGDRVHALLILRGRSFVKMARAGLLPIGGGLDAFVDHASRLERLRRSLSRDLDREERLAQERVALGKRRTTLSDRRALLQTEQAALARSHTAILAAEDREAAFRRAFQSSHETTRHTAVYGSGFGPADPYEQAAGFAATKGRLPFPIAGRAEVRPAKLAGGDSPGLEMVAGPGAAVRAVYRGRVAFADAYADYGKAVILDHGSGFFTVSGNLSAIDVQVGDEVGSGDKIGTVGVGAHGPVLYFELRRGATTVNPAPWFGI